MGHSKLKTRFSVAGRFTRFAIEDGFKIKGFYLNVAGEELLIKVPKRLRYYCADLLIPGATLQVSGKQTVNLKNDRAKYKAEDILPLATPMSGLSTASSAAVLSDDLTTGEIAKRSTANSHSSDLDSAAILDARAAVQPHPAQHRYHQNQPACIRVCRKSSCRKRGGDAVWAALETAIQDQNLGDRVKLKATGCMDKCKTGPNLVMPGKMRYCKVKAKSIPGLLEEHITSTNDGYT
ncbi:MAG: (2Fe-2S) ferredoxin domain-containing protein [Cyanobacteria bacterium P01_A01_bin.3]